MRETTAEAAQRASTVLDAINAILPPATREVGVIVTCRPGRTLTKVTLHRMIKAQRAAGEGATPNTP